MLSLLRGPIDIVPGDPWQHPPGVRVGGCQWVDERGLYFIDTLSSSFAYARKMYVTHLSGKAVLVGGPFYANEMGWSAIDSAPVVNTIQGNWGAYRLPTFHPISSGTYGGASLAPSPNRKIRYAGSGIVYSSSGLNAFPATVEYRFLNPIDAHTYNGLITYAGQSNSKHFWWCVEPTSGRFYKYNSTDKTEATGYVRSGFGSAVKQVAYSAKHDLFFVVRANVDTAQPDQLYVYANEVVPAALSAITLTPSARRGGRSKITTKLTGSYGEACVGVTVTFGADRGTVEPSAVATDSTGTATSYLYASVTDISAVTVTAEVI